VSIVYVCLDDDSLGLSAALALRQKVREQGIPVVVRMAHEGGLARLLGGEGGFENLHAFGLLDRTCTPEIVLGGTHERIARAIHEDYLRREGAKGQTADENEALVPWEALSEELKESNRRQADQMGQKLKSIGCGIAPLTDWQAAGFCFGDEQVEAMARMEHKRWMAERLREGYRLGPRDPEERTNPNLLPWEQLSAESRELTREMVRRIPVLLARVDLQVCRLVRPE
jgi:hypothetical protein